MSQALRITYFNFIIISITIQNLDCPNNSDIIFILIVIKYLYADLKIYFVGKYFFLNHRRDGWRDPPTLAHIRDQSRMSSKKNKEPTIFVNCKAQHAIMLFIIKSWSE